MLPPSRKIRYRGLSAAPLIAETLQPHRNASANTLATTLIRNEFLRIATANMIDNVSCLYFYRQFEALRHPLHSRDAPSTGTTIIFTFDRLSFATPNN